MRLAYTFSFLSFVPVFHPSVLITVILVLDVHNRPRHVYFIPKRVGNIPLEEQVGYVFIRMATNVA